MRSIICVIVLIGLVFMLTGCGLDSFEIAENIAAPRNLNLPIYGEWVIEDFRMSTISSMDRDEAAEYLGTKVVFHDKLVSIGENYCLNPSFKIKNVNADEYLTYYYKTRPGLLNIKSDRIQVVSVSDKEQFFNEFIKVDEDLIIVNIDGVFFYLSKETDLIENDNSKLLSLPEEIDMAEESSSKENGIGSGILIGLKSLNIGQEENMESWNYRTIFIRSYNREIVNIQETDGLMLPRRSGFWKIEVKRQELDGKINDEIKAYQLDKKTELKTAVDMNSLDQDTKESGQEQSTIKTILFAANDYISIENIHYRNKGQRYLEFYPIDNIGTGKSIKISDIMGEAGKEALIQGFNKEMAKEMDNHTIVDVTPKENSFGLFRRKGMWIFKGRVNYMEDGNYQYKDFNINILPTKELISFDELAIPWKAIKAKVPEAVDAFTSPNEDLAIVLTYGHILVFRIENGELSDEPIERIKLNSGEKVVMAEWALGKYSLLWDEQFK